jgi:hypothetical protein
MSGAPESLTTKSVETVSRPVGAMTRVQMLSKLSRYSCAAADGLNAMWCGVVRSPMREGCTLSNSTMGVGCEHSYVIS